MSNATKSAAETLTTSDLWAATHSALTSGRWSEARALLDVLGQRDDNHDTLGDVACYAPGVKLAADFADLLQDRIDLVNAKAER